MTFLVVLQSSVVCSSDLVVRELIVKQVLRCSSAVTLFFWGWKYFLKLHGVCAVTSHIFIWSIAPSEMHIDFLNSCFSFIHAHICTRLQATCTVRHATFIPYYGVVESLKFFCSMYTLLQDCKERKQSFHKRHDAPHTWLCQVSDIYSG